MDEQERQRTRQWVRNWEAVGRALERLRAEEIRNTDTVTTIEQ